MQALFNAPLTIYQKMFLLFLTTWSIVWKGIALWKSAKKNQKYWFIALLVLNTVGIAEIVYLSFFHKKTKEGKKKKVG